jgi:NAD(P)-dependent dehydrogenase (short-subunit alcohol dehydrogenase family)
MNKSVLIIGGTSSLAPKIINDLESKGYSIKLITFRQKNKIYGKYNWAYLNLEDMNSVQETIKAASQDTYEKIIFVSGNSLGNYGKDVPYKALQVFYDAFILRYNFLIKECSKFLSDSGQIVYISSMAANVAIPDANYSAAKAGVQAFVKSLSCQLKPDQSAFSISPGLIYGTKTFYDQNYTGDISSLASIDKISDIISNADKSYNGCVIEIGY